MSVIVADGEVMEGRSALGLTDEQARNRLEAMGPNSIPPPRRPGAVRRLFGGLTHFFAIMLWVAAALALVAGMPQLAIAITGVIVLNAVFAFVQESRADRAAERLSAMLPAKVTVVRSGRRVDIDAVDVVEGDLLSLVAGDRIPADAVIVREVGLRIDMSMLTGESRPVDTEVDAQILAGTFVVEGDADAVVTLTGERTRLAQIARLTTVSAKPVTPLAMELQKVVRWIALIAVSVGVLFFGVSALLGNPLIDGFIFAVGVTVALVPEALLPTVTLTLAWGAEQMAKRNVLVRRLEAVETLGSTTCICTDKTGTLTRNEMSVVRVWTPTGAVDIVAYGYEPIPDMVDSDESIRALAQAAVGCSDGYALEREGRWIAHGDPMEAALDVLARRCGLDTDAIRTRVQARFPFDPHRMRMSAFTSGLVVVKGAVDSVLACCTSQEQATQVKSFVDAWGAQGLRVIAIAERECSDIPADWQEAEAGLRLLGLVALQDPPRQDVTDALASCRSAGVAVIMVTGDHPATARAIADQVGLRESDGPVLVSGELPSDDLALARILSPGGVVVARVTPEDKLRIAQVLRGAGHVVAMTGDGVNDVPALHAANIGISMGLSGTDVAREAADLVLLDDHFGSIVRGIEQGRATFVNIRRFLTYHLTDNVAELAPFLVWALSGGNFPLALGVLQILALDIGTDTLTAVALGAEPPSKHLLQGPPIRGRLMNRRVLWRAFGILGPAEAIFSMAVFVLVLQSFGGWRTATAAEIAMASGAAFLTVVLGQMTNAWACRSSTWSPWTLGWFTNRLLVPAVAAGLVFSLVILLIPPVASVFGQAAPPAWSWFVAALAIPAVLGVDALDKSIRIAWRRRAERVC